MEAELTASSAQKTAFFGVEKLTCPPVAGNSYPPVIEVLVTGKGRGGQPRLLLTRSDSRDTQTPVSLLGVIHHPLEVDDHDVLVFDHPGIMPGRQERRIPRLARKLLSVIHNDFQGPGHVILKMRRFTALCFRDRLYGFLPTPPRFQDGAANRRAADRYQLQLPLGKTRTSSALSKLFSSAFGAIPSSFTYPSVGLTALTPRYRYS